MPIIAQHFERVNTESQPAVLTNQNDVRSRPDPEFRLVHFDTPAACVQGIQEMSGHCRLSYGNNPKRQNLDQTLSPVMQESASCDKKGSNIAIGFSTPKHKVKFLSGPKALNIKHQHGPKRAKTLFFTDIFKL
jgi:hypothetical protein